MSLVKESSVDEIALVSVPGECTMSVPSLAKVCYNAFEFENTFDPEITV